jgi:hypothetical protein
MSGDLYAPRVELLWSLLIAVGRTLASIVGLSVAESTVEHALDPGPSDDEEEPTSAE